MYNLDNNFLTVWIDLQVYSEDPDLNTGVFDGGVA